MLADNCSCPDLPISRPFDLRRRQKVLPAQQARQEHAKSNRAEYEPQSPSNNASGCVDRGLSGSELRMRTRKGAVAAVLCAKTCRDPALR